MASVPTAEQGVTINFEWLLGWTGGTQQKAKFLFAVLNRPADALS